VARGATNREVAAELFLSERTIEFHLGQVYRKLGLRSRTELALALRSLSENDELAVADPRSWVRRGLPAADQG
jgi:Bacterial regulatory proteins, luxR family